MISSVFVSTLILASAVPDYAMGWGTLSLINAGLAQSKNQSGLFWWILSLFFGPLITLIIVVFLQKKDLPQMKYDPDFR